MKHMKKPFALLLCVAMVLSMCMTFAGAADIRRYDTLDEIAENVSVFRSIRFGQMSHKRINGNSYWQFSKENFPTVQIKASAFMTAPRNNYLIADNLALSRNCKNPDGASRVCYFTKMSSSVYTNLEAQVYAGTPKFVQNDVYTVSIYRLELKADADFDNKIEVGAKLTSSVSFEYDAGRNTLKRKDTPPPLRPTVSVLVTHSSQDVRLKKYSITDSFGDYSGVSDGETGNIMLSAVGCAVGVANIFLAPEGISKTLAIISAIRECIPTVTTTIEYNSEKGYYSPYPVDYQKSVTFPIKLASYGNHVTTVYELNRTFDKSSTDFMVTFSFT